MQPGVRQRAHRVAGTWVQTVAAAAALFAHSEVAKWLRRRGDAAPPRRRRAGAPGGRAGARRAGAR
jgi:hypothetical protein